MKKHIHFFIEKCKGLHILHISAIAGCVLNLFVQSLVTAIFTTLIVSTIYMFFLYSVKRVSKPAVTNGGASVEDKQEITTSSENKKPDLIQHVTSTMKSKVSLIPVLTEQLKAVIAQTDSAAEGLISAFFGINRQSKKQLQNVNELFGSLTEQSGGNNLSETQQQLQELQGNFSKMTSFLDKFILMIENVVDQLGRVEEFASKIKKIGQMTNILAINAAIEAANSGEVGNGFKVIASEINTLSKGSTDSIKEITDITANLTSNITTIKRELESVHKDSLDIEKRTESLLGVALRQIDETLHNATEKVKNIAENADALNKEIGKVVVSIQFQDITRQRIEHVISPLDSLKNDVSDILQEIENKGDLSLHSLSNSSDSDLMQQYTMESEREILRNIQNKSS